jgi:class 3 adenylate cyclase/tetratricopeptide (TPR) repeat protein
MPLDFRFCGQCGSPLVNETVPKRQDAVQSESILQPSDTNSGSTKVDNQSPSPVLRGERRQVTVLVADVVRSTEILEQIGSEAWVEMMNQVLQIMGEAVYRFGGEVDQFRGDGMLAFFGAHTAHEDDPERAVLSALVLQDNITSYSNDIYGKLNRDLQVRIGINTGEVITANIGSRDIHSEDTAMGSAVTLAARLETAAKPGSVVVSEQTYRLVADRFNWDNLGELQVRGLTHPVSVYVPLKPLSDIEQQNRYPNYGLSIPLIGRDDELNTIQRKLKDLRSKIGGILLVSGEAGLGKSRLIFETHQQVIRQEALKDQSTSSLTWLQGRCRSYGQSLPDSMWVDMLQRWLGMGRWIQPEEALVRLQSETRRLWEDQYEDYFPYLGAFLSLPIDKAHAEMVGRLTGEGLRNRIFLAIYQLLEKLAQKQSLLIVFSEVHWVDEGSLELLKFCLPLCDKVGVLFMIVYRPERSSPAWAFQHFVETSYHHRLTTINLSPLDEAESRSLLFEMIGEKTLPSKVYNQIIQKSEGNPYYLTELVRSLIDKQILVRDSLTGIWHAVIEDIHLKLPETLKSLLLSRIDNLPLPERHILQMASVIGPIFWFEVLRVITDDNPELKTRLADLQRAERITERGTLPSLGREYAFTSTLIREAVYGSILSTQQAELHQQVASFLESVVQEDVLQNYHGIIAYHYSRAGNCAKELFHSMLSANHNVQVYANSEAIQAFQHALDLLDRTGGSECIPAGKTSEEWRLEALSGLGMIQFGIGEITDAEINLRSAVELGRQIDLDPASLTRLFYWLGEVLIWQNRYEEPIRLGEEGLYLLKDNHQSTEAALMNQLVAIGSGQLGDHNKFIDYTLRTAGFIQHLPYSEELRAAYDHIIALYSYTLKDVDEARRWLEILKKEAETHEDIRALGEYYEYSAVIHFQEGNIKEALPLHQSAIDMFTKIGDVKHASRSWKSCGVSHLQAGNIQEASDCFDKALETAKVFENKADYAIGHWYKAQALLCQGEWDLALESYQKAGVLVQDVPQLQKEWALSGVGRVYLARGNHQMALNPTLLALQDAPHVFFKNPYQANEILSGLEQAFSDPESFQMYSEKFRQEHPEVNWSAFSQWHLSPADVALIEDPPVVGTPFKLSKRTEDQQDKSVKPSDPPEIPDWEWIDPFGDCSYDLNQGLTIKAANERNLHHINRSAPRFLYMEAVSGDFTIQVDCQTAMNDRPAIGGLIVWQSVKYWFCLEAGTRGVNEITLRGFLENHDLVFGRGQLQAETKRLRLERRGNRLSAFCNAKEGEWFYAGSAELSTTRPVNLGIHAIGHINRMIYPGSYPHGTAIRFDEFWLWDC